MSIDSKIWAEFPYETEQYLGAALKKNWQRLHQGDCEPWPESEEIQQAWRLYHQGEFSQAYDLANKIGPQAHVVANKACGIYANHLETDDDIRINLYEDIAERAETAADVNPDDINAWYFQAFAYGRLGQLISITAALKKGYGNKIKTALENTLELEPEHAEANIAFGLYNAEIIDKIGKMIGSLTYGVSAENAIEHFQEAIRLTPESPIAQMEYGNGLYLLYGDKKIDQVTQAYIDASEVEPVEAMEILDQELAKSELE